MSSLFCLPCSSSGDFRDCGLGVFVLKYFKYVNSIGGGTWFTNESNEFVLIVGVGVGVPPANPTGAVGIQVEDFEGNVIGVWYYYPQLLNVSESVSETISGSGTPTQVAGSVSGTNTFSGLYGFSVWVIPKILVPPGCRVVVSNSVFVGFMALQGSLEDLRGFL